MNESRIRSPRGASRVSRRKFLRLTAAGAAAALAAPAASLARATAVSAKSAAPPKRTGAAKATPVARAPGRRVASPKEIEKLKGFLDGSLRAVRAWTLPPGSDMAFTFRAMKTRRARREG